MTNIASAPAGPDRARRALEILASADSLTTPEIVERAGERGVKYAMAWYGEDLRHHERRGWVERLGYEGGGWQQGRSVRWQITDAGRARLRQYELARSSLTTRQAAAERRETVAHEKLITGTILAAARIAYDESWSRESRLGLAQQLRGAGCTYREIGDIFGVSGEWIRVVLKQGSWQMAGAPGHKRAHEPSLGCCAEHFNATGGSAHA